MLKYVYIVNYLQCVIVSLYISSSVMCYCLSCYVIRWLHLIWCFITHLYIFDTTVIDGMHRLHFILNFAESFEAKNLQNFRKDCINFSNFSRSIFLLYYRFFSQKSTHPISLNGKLSTTRKHWKWQVEQTGEPRSRWNKGKQPWRRWNYKISVIRWLNDFFSIFVGLW